MNILSREAAPVFNAALAGVAAAAAAFFAFAMPNDLFAGLVAATGVDSLIPAAQPPLGSTARAAAMALAAATVFFLVWAVLRRVDALPNRVSSAAAEEEPSAILPRLRRADAHPDAPARRPLLARHELGEPEQGSEPAGETSGAGEGPPAEQAPAFLAAGLEQCDDASLESERRPDADIAPGAWEPSSAVDQDPPEPAESAAVASDANGQPGDALEEREALMARLPLPEDRGDSISVLFRRLDEGLANCEWPLNPSEEPKDQAPSDAEVRQDPVGDQLRSALDDLRKMAGGGA